MSFEDQGENGIDGGVTIVVGSTNDPSSKLVKIWQPSKRITKRSVPIPARRRPKDLMRNVK
jgi:hypothetical protein